MRSGASTAARRRRYRDANKVVLPEPAGAWTNTDPADPMARSRAALSTTGCRASLTRFFRWFERRRHPAQSVQITGLTGLQRRRYLRPSECESGSQRLDSPRPNADQCREIRHPFQLRAAPPWLEDIAPFCLGNESRFAGVYLGIGHGNQGFGKQQRIDRQLRVVRPVPAPIRDGGTGFVIDQNSCTIRQSIHPIDAHREIEAG